MAKFNVPASPTTHVFSLSDLLGVDYNDTVVDNKRSPKMTNLVNNNGFLESRYGHKILMKVDNANINGVWNIDARSEIFVVHCGTKLYEVSSDFETKLEIRSGLADVKSTGIYLDGELLILDGVRALIYHKVGDLWRVENLDEVGYIPTVSVSLAPDGTGGELYEPINQCSKYEIFSYISDGESTTYKLPEGSYGLDTPVVTRLDDRGDIVPVTVKTWNAVSGILTFNNPIPKSPVDGRDNLFIQVINTSVTCYINKCTFGTLFGYNGNNNRAFVSGNEEYPNVDWYSDLTSGLSYFPSTNYAKIGTEKITGYSRASDGALVIHKKLSDTDCTVYYRTYNMLNKEEVFPLTSGVKNIGCLTHACCANFLNDPVFLSELGVYALSASVSTTNEKFAHERSYYINRNLLNEPNLENAVAIVNGNRYYLAINDNIYVADKRFLSHADLSATADNSGNGYQFEWFYLTDVPVRIFFNWNGKLYFGDREGYIRTFDETSYLDDVYDEETEEIIKVPFNVYYETPYLYLNDYTKAKTIRRLYVHCLPTRPTSIKLSYETPDGLTEVSTINYDGMNPFPKTMQEKEKVSKIMSCKLIVEGLDGVRCSFSSIIAEYRMAGKYRGE